MSFRTIGCLTLIKMLSVALGHWQCCEPSISRVLGLGLDFMVNLHEENPISEYNKFYQCGLQSSP